MSDAVSAASSIAPVDGMNEVMHADLRGLDEHDFCKANDSATPD